MPDVQTLIMIGALVVAAAALLWGQGILRNRGTSFVFATTHFFGTPQNSSSADKGRFCSGFVVQGLFSITKTKGEGPHYLAGVRLAFESIPDDVLGIVEFPSEARDRFRGFDFGSSLRVRRGRTEVRLPAALDPQHPLDVHLGWVFKADFPWDDVATRQSLKPSKTWRPVLIWKTTDRKVHHEPLPIVWANEAESERLFSAPD